MLQSPAPTALFVQLKPNKLISIGSGTSSDLRLPGTALNHITINGVDKLLSNGSTEVGLNGVNIIEETVLVHGDILRRVCMRLIIRLVQGPWTGPKAYLSLIEKSIANCSKFAKLQAYLP